MYNTWSEDMNKTQPYIEQLQKIIFKGVDFVSIEKKDDEVLLWLDQYAGIDYVVKSKNNNIIGIAARIQFMNFRTFTIRKTRYTGTKTEFEKRIEAIEKGYIFPAYTLQAYFLNKNFSHAAIIPTKQLYNFIINNPNKVHERKSDNIFLFVNWNDLKNTDLKIFES